jgi:hypothetical protein
MVVRSAQKNMDDVQKIRAAMDGNKPVITVAQQELIIKYVDIIGEDGKAMIEAIEEEARKPDKMPADIFKLIDSCLTSLSQKAKKARPIRRSDKAEGTCEVAAGGGHRGACNDAPRQPAQWRQAR